jgi:hypothetical protein
MRPDTRHVKEPSVRGRSSRYGGTEGVLRCEDAFTIAGRSGRAEGQASRDGAG